MMPTLLHAARFSRNTHRGFTLVELLVVIAIIGLLSSALMFSLFGIIEDGNIARTKTQITRINELLNERFDTYRTRAIPMTMAAGTTPINAAKTRLNCMRELMRMEMPDRITDVQDAPVSLPTTPSLTLAYRRKARSMVGADPMNANLPDYSKWKSSYQGAECLYMIMQSLPDGDGNGLNFFTPSEMGDVDGDGMPEILDAWRHPIEFLRWAPGFVSDRQVNDGNTAPDPFDPLKVDTRWSSITTQANVCFLLYPLVYSPGPDGLYDIISDDSGSALHYKNTTPPNDPYYNPGGDQFGKQMDANGDGFQSHYDNIHNHLIEIK